MKSPTKSHSLFVLTLVSGFLLASFAQAEPAITVLHVWQTTDRLLYSNPPINIFSNKTVADDTTFGPPKGWAGPKDGHMFLLAKISITASTDDQWVKRLESVALKDGDKTFRFNLWLFNGAYRGHGFFLDMAKGQGVNDFSSTTIGFHLEKPLSPDLLIVADGVQPVSVAKLLASTATKRTPIPAYSLEQETTAFSLADGVSVSADPQFSSDKKPLSELKLGQEVKTTGVVSGNWVQVIQKNPKAPGWVHRGALTQDQVLCEKAKTLAAEPKTLVVISDIENAASFKIDILAGGMRLGTKRLLADHGMCLVVSDHKLPVMRQGISLKGFGVEQTLSNVLPWTPYSYSSRTRKFELLSKVVEKGERVVAGEPLPSEPAAVSIAKSMQAAWPDLPREIEGRNLVRVVNSNAFAVKVGLRSAAGGKDFSVAPGDSATASAPDGRYDVYFRYENEPESLYQGDAFSLAGSGVQIDLVKVINGNYMIHKVK